MTDRPNSLHCRSQRSMSQNGNEEDSLCRHSQPVANVQVRIIVNCMNMMSAAVAVGSQKIGHWMSAKQAEAADCAGKRAQLALIESRDAAVVEAWHVSARILTSSLQATVGVLAISSDLGLDKRVSNACCDVRASTADCVK